jgi:hypothetical protein
MGAGCALIDMRRTSAEIARVAIAVVVLSACVDRTVSEVEPVQDNVETFDVPTVVERDVDILFVIDSSPSMAEEHASLRANFGALLDRLDDTPEGLPNVHLGVVSSDMGTAPYNVNSQCRADGGDRGLLHGAACSALGGASFIEDVLDADGSRRRNYAGALEDVFGCTADVGVDGCGFERHLDAMKAALTPGANGGFVREDAMLAVVFLADEDDCSASDPRLYDANNTALGPLTDFRCHTQGVVCEDDPDPGAPGERTGCVARDDSAYLESIDAYVDFLVDLKGNERDVIVGAIVGDPEEVQIGVDAQGRPELLAGCPSGGLGASEPGIRFAELLGRFTQSSFSTLCAGDLRGALEDVGEKIGSATGVMCLGSAISDRNPVKEGVQSECSMVETLESGVERVIPSCDAAAAPCWSIVNDGMCAQGFGRLVIDRAGAPAPEDGRIRAQCTVE